MCTPCEWQELRDEIEEMLDDEEETYEFAEDTLRGILDWIVDASHCTDKQREAVENIRSGGDRAKDARESHWDRD